MKLSKLAYLCVKNAIYYDDSSFTYEKFLEINTDNSNSENYIDYDTFVNNVFNPLNEAIARLNDLEKIPYKVVNVADYLEGNQIDIRELSVKEVINVAQMTNDTYKKLNFRELSNTHVIITTPFVKSKQYPIFIEYKVDIPYFTREDIPQLLNVTTEYDSTSNIIEATTTDVDLKDYGISDSMCNFIIEYVRGRLEEQIDIQAANMHITRAEQYFNNIRQATQAFSQTVVDNKYKVGF